MTVTEVRVTLEPPESRRLLGFATIIIDDSLAIRDLKIIAGNSGIFVAMPSRKIQDACPRCQSKNNLLARFCNGCGGALATNRGERDEAGKSLLYFDVAFPIHCAARRVIEDAVLAEYQKALQGA